MGWSCFFFAGRDEHVLASSPLETPGVVVDDRLYTFLKVLSYRDTPEDNDKDKDKDRQTQQPWYVFWKSGQKRMSFFFH
jgi:hypothetical protein